MITDHSSHGIIKEIILLETPLLARLDEHLLVMSLHNPSLSSSPCLPTKQLLMYTNRTAGFHHFHQASITSKSAQAGSNIRDPWWDSRDSDLSSRLNCCFLHIESRERAYRATRESIQPLCWCCQAHDLSFFLISGIKSSSLEIFLVSVRKTS